MAAPLCESSHGRRLLLRRLNLGTDAEQGSGGPEKFRLMEGNRWSRVESDWGQTMFLVFSLKKTPHELPSQFTVRRGKPGTGAEVEDDHRLATGR